MKETDETFIVRRRRAVSMWPCVAVAIWCGLAVMLVWMNYSQPELVNPYAVAEQLAAGTYAQSSLELAAILLPVALVMWFVIVAIFVGVAFLPIQNERRYLRMLAEERNMGGK
jgi:hypothetical protein